jgi:hypothetical protein
MQLHNRGQEGNKDRSFGDEERTGKRYMFPSLKMFPTAMAVKVFLSILRDSLLLQSVNFETGLCVLFSSSARQAPGKRLHHRDTQIKKKTNFLLSYLKKFR